MIFTKHLNELSSRYPVTEVGPPSGIGRSNSAYPSSEGMECLFVC